MDVARLLLGTTTLLCSLVAGLLFTFAVVVMPGIRHLDDRAYLRAFRTIDRVIQDGQPLFALVWVGSVLVLVSTTILALVRFEGSERMLMVSIAAIYLLAVQLPTLAVNIPLNNQVQRLELDSMDATELEAARRAFEPRWVRWNGIRTLASVLVAVGLIVLGFRG